MAAAINPDLQLERERASFTAQKLTWLLDGGVAQTQRRRRLRSIIERDPTGIFSNDDNIYLHRTERHVRALAKHVRLVELCRKLGIGEECGGEVCMSADWAILTEALADDLPTSLHWVMFVPNIVSLFDEQQQAEFLPQCRDWRMIGCYAQTEVGHGSNIRALQTTATFRSQANGGGVGGSFVIHSPAVTSTKFWPGTLGRTANHAMIIARLIDGQGVDRGIHNFLVPLRSQKDHKLLPGVTTGDLGPKLGYNNMDNGFCRFDKVRIPRRNMAMRFATVDEQGNYRKLTNNEAAEKVAYITMMQVRALICTVSGTALAQACTIAIRYSAVRRQGYKNQKMDDEELQVLDYRQQQARLFPLLAASYLFHFTGHQVLKRLKAVEKKLQSASSTATVVTKTETTDLHASSSALKSFLSGLAADGIEDCRKACGGHGYLQSSGLPELSTTFLMNPTVEGDNQMLPQQVVKVLLKLIQAVQNNDDLSDYEPCDSRHLIPSIRSVLRQSPQEKCQVLGPEEWRGIDVLLAALRHRAARLLAEVALQIQSSVIEHGNSEQEAWNDALVSMARVSRAYSQFLVLQSFSDAMQDPSVTKDIIRVPGSAESEVLHDLASLFALYCMEKDLGDFLEDGYMSAEQARWIRSAVLKLLDLIRPNAVALVDARDFSDFRLKSTIGRYDGNVYPAILEASRRDPLNHTEPGPGYEPHLRRLIRDGVGVYAGTTSRL